MNSKSQFLVMSMMAAVILMMPSFDAVGQQPNRQRRPARFVQVDNSDQLLLMRNGSFMKGQIKTISTGYLVSTDIGKTLIPFAQARFVADSVEDAYLRLRLEVRNPTVAIHSDLAEWCLRHKLFRQAERELRDALRLDPENETIRLRLHRVQEQQPKQPRTTAKPARAEFANVDRPEARSLSGLHPSTAKYFVSVIQPLVASRCGNARCHGPATATDFQITRVRFTSGTHRIATERNLAAIFRYLNLERPGSSELLQVAKNSHVGQAMFSGRAGAVQLRNLEQWIEKVSDELRPNKKANSILAARQSQRAGLLQVEPANIPMPTRAVSSQEPTRRFPLPTSPPISRTARRSATTASGQDVAIQAARAPNGAVIPIGKGAESQSSPDGSDTRTQPQTPHPEGILRSNFQQLLDQEVEKAQHRADHASDPFDPNEFNAMFSSKSRQE